MEGTGTLVASEAVKKEFEQLSRTLLLHQSICQAQLLLSGDDHAQKLGTLDGLVGVSDELAERALEERNRLEERLFVLLGSVSKASA